MLLTIAPKGEKGRAFSAHLLSYAVADTLWVSADNRATRPIWAVLAGPSEQLRAFTANLLLGAVATDGKDRGGFQMEIQRSAPYRSWTRQLAGGGSTVTFALPGLLGWAPPLREEHRFRFIILPERAWVDAQRFDLDDAADMLAGLSAHEAAETRHTPIPPLSADLLHRFLGYGGLLLHYLDARLPLPLPRSPVFGAWLIVHAIERHYMIAAPERPASRWGHGRDVYTVSTPERAGVYPGVMFRGHDDQEQNARWLGREVARWFTCGGGV